MEVEQVQQQFVFDDEGVPQGAPAVPEEGVKNFSELDLKTLVIMVLEQLPEMIEELGGIQRDFGDVQERLAKLEALTVGLGPGGDDGR